MKSVSVIGFGALGKILCSVIGEKLSAEYRINGVLDHHYDVNSPDYATYGYTAFKNIDELIAGNPDYVIEIAGGRALKEYAEKILEAKISLIITSVGALADQDLYDAIKCIAQKNGTKVHVTSGAIGGFDIFQTISLMGNATGIIENYKAPKSLNGAPYLNGVELPDSEERLVFSGNAIEAIAGFPKNVNVAVASALTSVGTQNMKVEITSVPDLEDNIHKITIQNSAAKAVLEVSSTPDPVNPKSSIVTAWSVAAFLKQLASPIVFF